MMLREIRRLKQQSAELKQRWFSAADMELVVWIDKQQHITRYQLSYDIPFAEKALLWSQAHGFSHSTIDDGCRPGKHPGAPLFKTSAEFDCKHLLVLFEQNAQQIDETVFQFVLKSIKDCC